MLRHLQKDFLDQRTALLSVLALSGAVASAAMWIDEDVSVVAWWPFLIAVTAMLTGAAMLGVDLFGGEIRRDTVRLIARMPGGLATASWSKVIFAVSCIGSLALVGFGIGFVAIRVSPNPGFEFFPTTYAAGAFFLLTALAVALWTMPVSCFVTRGVAAVPVTLVLLALMFSPVMVATADSWAMLRELVSQSWIAVWLCVGGLLAAATVFRLLTKRTFARRDVAGALAVGCVFLSPAVLLGLQRVSSWVHFDPESRSASIQWGLLSENQSKLLLAVSRSAPMDRSRPWIYTIAVDLETPDSAPTQIGPPDKRSIKFPDPCSWMDRASTRRGLKLGTGWVDVDTASIVSDPEGERSLSDAVARAMGAVRTPNGGDLRRSEGGLAEFIDGLPSGRTVEVPGEPSWLVRPVGFGGLVYVPAPNRGQYLCDAIRMRAFDLEIPQVLCAVVEPGWVVAQRRRRSTEPALLQIYDPERDELRALPGLRDGEEFVTCLDARRILVGSTRGELHGWVDTVTGDRGTVDVDPSIRLRYPSVVAWSADLNRALLTGWNRASGANGGGVLLFLDDAQSTIPRLEAVELPQSGARVIYWDRADRVLVHDARRVFWIQRDGSTEDVFALGGER